MPAAFFLTYLGSVIFNPATIWAFDISSDTRSGNIRQSGCNPFETFGDFFWALIIEKTPFNKCPELLVQGNFLALSTVISQADIGDLFGILRLVSPVFYLLLELIPKTAFAAMKGVSQIAQRISFVFQYLNLAALGIGQAQPFCVFS